MELPTINHPSTILLHCAECYYGHYINAGGNFVCGECDHTVTASALDLPTGAVLVAVPTTAGDRVGYVTTEVAR